MKKLSNLEKKRRQLAAQINTFARKRKLVVMAQKHPMSSPLLLAVKKVMEDRQVLVNTASSA
jgi:hypothetical protein